ncbi:hypothetical protein [Halosegnis sp.]|uniref:DUF7504 family protein n=1 Tax=Halosegnis sp. TaxID=2864959 RepID=UPI0035D43672
MADSQPLADALGDARSTLVVAGSLDDRKQAVCDALLARGDKSPTLLAVTYDRSGKEWLADATGALGSQPAGARVVDAGGDSDRGTGGTAVRTAAPDDLTGIQIALTEAFPLAGEGVFCLDSLTTLLQYVDPPAAYRFLNDLLGRLWLAGVPAHVHLDPAAHGPSTVRALAGLFDAAVAADPDTLSAPTRPAVVTDYQVAVAAGAPPEGND